VSQAIPISQAVGRTIRCPDPGCGRPSSVRHAVSRVRPEALRSEAIRTAYLWYRVDCPSTGAKLFRDETMVELIDEPQPEGAA
jgi:hypothetical protein